MKKIWLVIIPLIVVIFFLNHSNNSDEEYIDNIHKYWEEKHDFFKISKASPFLQKKKTYVEVQYFEPNRKYEVKGKLERINKREVLTLTNSDGTTTSYLKYAHVHFKLKNEMHTILLLKALGFSNQYLFAFGDDTSGDSTYGGGRYLDVVVGKSDQITLDFNKAYNPYCAYFDDNDFSCPLPPKTNLLKIAIEAGEKNYPN